MRAYVPKICESWECALKMGEQVCDETDDNAFEMHALNTERASFPFEGNKKRHREREDRNGLTLRCSLSSMLLDVFQRDRSIVAQFLVVGAPAKRVSTLFTGSSEAGRARAFRLKAAALLSFI